MPVSRSADILAPPQREVEQVPDLGPISRRQYPLHSVRIKKVCLSCELSEDTTAVVPEPVEEELVNRDAESLLGPVNQLVRDHPANCTLEHALELAVAIAHIRRNAHCELYELVVEERHSPF